VEQVCNGFNVREQRSVRRSGLFNGTAPAKKRQAGTGPISRARCLKKLTRIVHQMIVFVAVSILHKMKVTGSSVMPRKILFTAYIR
jgi:hypothetical protein